MPHTSYEWKTGAETYNFYQIKLDNSTEDATIPHKETP